jgi:predicted transcriptional regulator
MGRPATGKRPHVAVRVDEETLSSLRLIAEREGVGLSDVLRRAVAEFLKREKRRGRVE